MRSPCHREGGGAEVPTAWRFTPDMLRRQVELPCQQSRHASIATVGHDPGQVRDHERAHRCYVTSRLCHHAYSTDGEGSAIHLDLEVSLPVALHSQEPTTSPVAPGRADGKRNCPGSG